MEDVLTPYKLFKGTVHYKEVIKSFDKSRV